MELVAIQYQGRTDNGDTATVTIINNSGEEIIESALSDKGLFDAICIAINKALSRAEIKHSQSSPGS